MSDLSTKGVDLTELLGGDIKEDWWMEVPQRCPGAGRWSPPEAEAFCETTHDICVKIQQTTVAVTRVDILNDITSKILGGHVPPVP